MLKKNEVYEVEIVDDGFQGEGIAKIENFPVFVDGAIKGEKLEIKILKVQSSFAYGKILKIIKPVASRVEADCKEYGKCGGCNLRHINYEYTLKIKKAIVENCMYKQFGREIKVEDVIGMDKPLFYRNKLQYPVGFDNEGNPVMGVYSSRTHNIVPVTNCHIQNEKCNKIANDIFEFIKQNNISVYDEKTLKGTVRHIVIRIGIKTDEVLVTIVVNDEIKNPKNKAIKPITAYNIWLFSNEFLILHGIIINNIIYPISKGIFIIINKKFSDPAKIPHNIALIRPFRITYNKSYLSIGSFQLLILNIKTSPK